MGTGSATRPSPPPRRRGKRCRRRGVRRRMRRRLPTTASLHFRNGSRRRSTRCTARHTVMSPRRTRTRTKTRRRGQRRRGRTRLPSVPRWNLRPSRTATVLLRLSAPSPASRPASPHPPSPLLSQLHALNSSPSTMTCQWTLATTRATPRPQTSFCPPLSCRGGTATCLASTTSMIRCATSACGRQERLRGSVESVSTLVH
mmetsp:Transcript_20589/g.47572  ORF Transcript_20589/g.47572 Transcript_20589/m.47572 type:complete len:201 (-) Transcript_20589:46-648(-)